MKKFMTSMALVLMASAMALSAAAAPMPKLIAAAPTAESTAPVEYTLTVSDKYVQESKLLTAYRHTSALTSENIDMDILTNSDADDRVVLKKTDEESSISFAFGLDFKAKEVVLGSVKGSATYALYVSDDGQTWTETTTRTVKDKANDVLRILNSQGKAKPFLKLVITPSDDEVSFGSFTIAQASGGHDFSDVPITSKVPKQLPIYPGVKPVID